MSVPSLLRSGHRLAVLAPMAAVLVLALTLVATLSPERPAAALPAPHSFADPIFSTDARGDITTIGNVTTTCDPSYANQHWSATESAAACDGARSGATGTVRFDGAPMPPINNRLAMRHVDVDDDPGTFASSTADLHIPTGATVLWAGLHWNAATDVPSAPQLYGSTFEAAPPNVADRFRVRFTTPASTSCWATPLPVAALARSSTATISIVTGLPLILKPLLLISSTASFTPLCMSWPSAARLPDMGCATPILMTEGALSQPASRPAAATTPRARTLVAAWRRLGVCMLSSSGLGVTKCRFGPRTRSAGFH